MAKSDPIITWEAPEYLHSEKSADWFWAVGILSLAISITAIIIGNILFGVFIIVAAITLVLYTLRKPETVEFSISELGVRVAKKFYSFESLESFWIEEDTNKLLIRSQKLLMPYLVVPLFEEDHEDAHEVLIEFLDEENLHEPISQQAMEWLGF